MDDASSILMVGSTECSCCFPVFDGQDFDARYNVCRNIDLFRILLLISPAMAIVWWEDQKMETTVEGLYDTIRSVANRPGGEILRI